MTTSPTKLRELAEHAATKRRERQELIDTLKAHEDTAAEHASVAWYQRADALGELCLVAQRAYKSALTALHRELDEAAVLAFLDENAALRAALQRICNGQVFDSRETYQLCAEEALNEANRLCR